MRTTKFLFLTSLVACTSSVQDDAHHIDVPANPLGVVALETRGSPDHGYVMDALLKGGDVLATIKVRVGQVSGVVEGVTDEGTEVTVTYRGKQTLHALTFLTENVLVEAGATSDLDTRVLLDLATIRTTLQEEGRISVEPAPPVVVPDPVDTAYDEYMSGCPTSFLQTSPVANQCCRKTRTSEPHRPVGILDRTGWVASASPEGEPAAYAIDGSTSTRFSTGTAMAPGQWFQVDMGGCNTVKRIVLDSGTSTGDYSRSFTAYGSWDGTHWTQMESGTATSSPGSVNIDYNTDRSMRYLKVMNNVSADGSWWSLADFKVYGFSCGSQLSRSSWTATGYEADGSQVPNYDAWSNPQWGGLAIDASTSTRFSTGTGQTSGQYLQIDLGACYVINQIIMDSAGSPGDYARGYEITMADIYGNWTSWNKWTGTPDWSPVIITRGLSNNTGDEEVTQSYQSGRYIKIKQTGSSGSWWSIHDLNVWGYPCSEATQGNQDSTTFVRATDNAKVYRYRNPAGTGCVGFGGESCSGSACYYGPNAFGAATIYTTSPGLFPHVETTDNVIVPNCLINDYTTQQTNNYANVTGTVTPGQGCPGGNGSGTRWQY